MMMKTVSGVYVPVMATNQLPRYEMRANALMSDLHNSLSDASTMDAITKKVVEDTKESQEIAKSAADKAKNPRRGHHRVDEWA